MLNALFEVGGRAIMRGSTVDSIRLLHLPGEDERGVGCRPEIVRVEQIRDELDRVAQARLVKHPGTALGTLRLYKN